MDHESPTVMPSAPVAVPAGRAGPAGIGPYRVLLLLGEGGFGSVYLAEQTEPVKRRVALKVIKPGMDSRAVVARFEAERQALALMDHPGVAKMYDAGVAPDGRPYFAMEYVQGEPIARFCEQHRLGVPDRVRLMIQVCEAVQHAHVKGVIHRDLKPSNVLVAQVDTRPVAKVIDFGVAKALVQRLTDSTIVTEHGQMIGTPEYMAPEQARGSPFDVDTRSDVYSLGAILYELLTGVPPLDSTRLRSGGYANLQRIIEEEQPLPPSERVTRLAPAEGSSIRRAGDPTTISRRLRGDLDWIVLRCLEKEPNRRYDSAGALARDLSRFLADEPVEASPPSVAYRAAKFIRRHKGAVGAASALALVLVAGVIGTSLGLSWALRERARASAEAGVAVQARDEAEAVTAFLVAMLESVEPEGDGRDVTVRAVLDRSSRTLGTELADRPLVEARLRETIGNAYSALGHLGEADRHLPLAAEIRRRTLGEGHPDTLRAVSNLGALRHAQGRYEEAGALFARAREGFERAGIDYELMTLGLENNLAQVLARRGRIAEAEALQRRVVDGYTRRLGPDHERTLGCTVNLASLCEASGRLDEAESLLTRAAEGWAAAAGPEHPGTLLAQYNLADLYRRLGRPGEAESLSRRVLETRARVLGEEHPQTIAARSTLALALTDMERFEEAEREYAASWALARRVLGDDHDSTRLIALNFMTLYEGLGWPERSREPVAELVPVLRSAAESGTATADALNSYAWLLLTVKPESLRDHAAALRAATEAVAMERALGAGAPDLWQYLDTLALARARTGDHAGAVACQREAIGLLRPENEQYRAEMEGRLAEFERAAGGG